MVKFVTVGNLTIDDIVLPSGEHKGTQCGGNCLYAAVGANVWSDAVGIVSLVGTDFPREWLTRIESAGIDLRGIILRAGMPTMRAGLEYMADGERTILDDRASGRGEYEKRTDEWLDWLLHSPFAEHFPEAYSSVAGMHLAPMPVQAHLSMIEAIEPIGPKVTLDAPWWDAAAGDHRPQTTLLERLDALLPSLAEVHVFCGREVSPVAGLHALGELGAATTVIKLGEAGCLVYNRRSQRTTSVSAFPAKTVDPTGAGDAFCGGFLVGLVETGDPVEAARYGTVSASFVVEGFSSLYALKATREEAEQRLNYVQTREL